MKDSVNILGVDIPLVTIAYCTSTTRERVVAVIGEWNNYYAESSADIAKALDEFEKYKGFFELCYDNTVFKDIAERNSGMPVCKPGVNRQIFQYADV